jgi:hypothetical protein
MPIGVEQSPGQACGEWALWRDALIKAFPPALAKNEFFQEKRAFYQANHGSPFQISAGMRREGLLAVLVL